MANGSKPRRRAYAWGVLAALTCPCHLPVFAVLLAGTSAGAFIGDHGGIAAVALAGLFLLSLARTIRALRETHERPVDGFDWNSTGAGTRTWIGRHVPVFNRAGRQGAGNDQDDEK